MRGESTNCRPGATRLSAKALVLVLLALACALFVRALLETRLHAHGWDKNYAGDIAYLVVPPILALLLCPLLRDNASWLRCFLALRRVSLSGLAVAIALGLLIRVTWWAQLIASVSFGMAADPKPGAPAEFHLQFECPPPAIFATGLLVTAMLVPIVEETLHRGIVQSSLSNLGNSFAIVASAAIFAAFHGQGSYAFIFIVGLALGIQFQRTQTLWTGIATHATYNGLIQFDWRCLQSTWNPPPGDIPLYVPGFAALGAMLGSVTAAAFVLARCAPGHPERTGTKD